MTNSRTNHDFSVGHALRHGWSLLVLLSAWTGTAHAADFPRLDEAIPEASAYIYAPVFDFDGDGCLPSAGISRGGQQNPGLQTTGSKTGDCRSSNFLDTSNTLHRSACAYHKGSKYCGHFYALYFEKDQVYDQSLAGADLGHRHDWEYAAIWTKNGDITHGSRSAHGDLTTRAYSELPLENGRMKIVYHKDGHNVWSTHALRFAGHDEKAENPYRKFVTPTIVSWYSVIGDGLDNAQMRARLNCFDYEDASIPLKDSRFLDELNEWKPWNDVVFYPEDTLPSSDGVLPLNLFWSGGHRLDNFTTSTIQGAKDADAAGYKFAGVEGYVSKERQYGQVPLVVYWHPGRGDNFTTATAYGARAAEAAGYVWVRVAGYVYPRYHAGLVALKLYWHPGRGDNFTTATAEGRAAALAAGYLFVRVEGWVWPNGP